MIVQASSCAKTFGTYDEFKEAFTSFEKVISYDLKTTVLGYRLCVAKRARGQAGYTKTCPQPGESVL